MASAINGEESSLRGWLGTLADLAKARLTFLVLLTTLVGFCMGSAGNIDLPRLFHVLCGTALLAGGAACLNQLFEKELDARMERTRDRPLPAGRIGPSTALALGVVAVLLGVIWLLVLVNPASALVGGITLVTYLFIYTPLKTRTSLNTLVGAIPGALPPLIGWAAAEGRISTGGWALFALQFFWQMPHFLAIAWLYREDYARGGFRMLPIIDPTGRRTGSQVVFYTVGLLGVSLALFTLGMAGAAYAVGAILLGAGFLILGVRFAGTVDQRSARWLFLGSVLYLPLLLGLMVWDKAG